MSVDGCEVEEVSCIDEGFMAEEEDEEKVIAGAGSIESYGLREVEAPLEEEEEDAWAWSCLILSRAISHVSMTLMFSPGLFRYSSRIGMEATLEIAPIASAACQSEKFSVKLYTTRGHY